LKQYCGKEEGDSFRKRYKKELVPRVYFIYLQGTVLRSFSIINKEFILKNWQQKTSFVDI